MRSSKLYVNVMARIKRFLGTIINMYFSFIYPYLTYGCILWLNNYDSPLSSAVKLQNKVVRIINDVPIRDHVLPFTTLILVLKFSYLIKLHTCLFL